MAVVFGSPETWNMKVDEFLDKKDSIQKADVIDMMSPGPLRDELRGTFDPTQETYEEYLQRQAIQQIDRPLTGQAPSDSMLEPQRMNLNEGGVIGPGGMFRGEDLGTREGFGRPKLKQPNITQALLDKVKKLGELTKNTGVSVSVQKLNDPTRTPRIRMSYSKTTDGERIKKPLGNFDVSNQGIEQVKTKLKEIKKDPVNYPPTDPRRGAGVTGPAQKEYTQQKIQWTQEAIDFIEEETKKPIYHNDSKAVEKIEKKLLEKFSDIKYSENGLPKGVRPKDAFIRPSTAKNVVFFAYDYVFPEGSPLEGVQIKDRPISSGVRAQRDLIGIGLLRNSGDGTRWKNLSNSATTFFNPPPEGQPKTYLSGPNKDELKRFSKKFNLQGARAQGKQGGSLLANYFVNQGADFKKYKLQSEFARATKIELEEELKRPGLTSEQKIQVQNAIDELDTYERIYKRQLYDKYPSLFKTTQGGKGLVFEHLIARSIPESTGELFQSFERLPYDYRLRGRHVPLYFNKAKLKAFDLPLIDLIDQYENASDLETRRSVQTDIENLQKDFNNKTKIKGGKGYLDNLKITFKPNQVILKDVTPVVGAKPVSQQQFYLDAAEGIEYSNSYFKNTGQKNRIIAGPEYEKFKLAINKTKSPTGTTGKLGALGTYGSYVLLGGAMLKPVIEGFLQDQGILEKPRGVRTTSLVGEKYIPEESSFAEDAALTALGGATVLGGGLAGKKLIEKTTGRFAPMIKGAIGKTLTSPFALPFRATGLDRMAMKKLGLIDENETLAQTYDPRTASGRTALGLEATAASAYRPIAKSLTSGIKDVAKKTLARRVLSLGPAANFLARVGRVTTPLGVASLLGEGAYQLLVKPQKEYLESLDPEERKTVEQQYADVAAAEGGLIRKGYKEAGLVEKLGKGAQAFDPRNLPYYGSKLLKGIASGTEMAIKFPVAAGMGIGTLMQQKPSKKIFNEFIKAMEPKATQYLSEKTGLESLIRSQEKELAEKRPGALAIGDVVELGGEFLPPATGYVKMIEDTGSKFYKILRDAKAKKELDPIEVEEVARELDKYGIDRRDFLKITGGSSLYLLAKHIGLVDAVKVVEKTRPVRLLTHKTTTNMPSWFPGFVEKIIDDPKSVFEKVDEDVVKIINKDLPDVEILKYDNGRLELTGENNFGAKYLIEYDSPAVLEDGAKYPGDFAAHDTRYYAMGPDDYTKEVEVMENVDDVFGGTTKLEEYATGVKKKELTRGEKSAIDAEMRAESEADYLRETSDDFE